MLKWFISNKDNLLTGLLVTFATMPIIYYFTIFMDMRRQSKFSDFGDNIKERTTRESVREINVEVITVTKYVEQEEKSSETENSSSGVFIIGLVGIVTFISNKNLILQVIYWIALIGFIFNLFLYLREVKIPSVKHLRRKLLWTCLMWCYILVAIFILYHPVYYADEMLIFEKYFNDNTGPKPDNLDGFSVLVSQFVGTLILILIILYNIGLQIYSLGLWWNRGILIEAKNSILVNLHTFYHPNRRLIIFSTILMILSFITISGIYARVMDLFM